jgi:hypothetical protein
VKGDERFDQQERAESGKKTADDLHEPVVRQHLN